MSQFLTYAKFQTEEDASEITTILTANNIYFILEKETEVLDKIYLGETLDPLWLLKIDNSLFDTVNTLIKDNIVVDVNSINKDYYLFQFPEEELKDVVNTPSDWNYFDQALAQKLLKEKGIDIAMPNTSTIANTNNNYTPISIPLHWLALQYILSIFVPFAGFLIGGIIWVATKTLPNGSSVKMFDEHARIHAVIIFTISIVRACWFFFSRI